MEVVPKVLYRAEQVRALEQIAIDQYSIPATLLMERAGAVVFARLQQMCTGPCGLIIVCGPGNNGGDGYVVARLALQQGWAVQLASLGEPATGEAAQSAYQAFVRQGGVCGTLDDLDWCAAQLVVDALLGTGLRRTVTGSWAAAIDAMNNSGLPIIAVDIPSGLHADTGQVMGCAVQAAVTVSFIGLKCGLFTGQGPHFVGRLWGDDLAVPAEAYDAVPAAAIRLSGSAFAQPLAPRGRCAHKGNHGNVLVIGGDQGMPGAVRLCAEAALRSGAGLVRVATHPQHSNQVITGRPELLCASLAEDRDVAALIDAERVIALGPGLGRSAWSREIFFSVLDHAQNCRMVVDADGLNWLAGLARKSSRWILTPHPGEAARLLSCTVAEIEQDRFAAVAAIQAEYGGVCVLKGCGSLVCDGQYKIAVCDAGNPGMASAGMGDVLTGIIAGLLAQGLPLQHAAKTGVWLHAKAADAAAQDGERGLLAADLFAPLRIFVNASYEAGRDGCR